MGRGAHLGLEIESVRDPKLLSNGGGGEVRDVERLRYSLISVEEWIEDHLTNEITHPYKNCEHIGKLLWGLNGFFRTRAILKYLLDADTDAFFADLTREALTYVTLLRAYREKLDVPASRVKGSTASPVSCALATANFELAVEIDELMPQQMGKYDDKELFAITSMVRRLVVGNKAEIALALKEVADACPGAERCDAIIEMVQGLGERSEKRFNSGLAGYLESLEHLSPDEVEELRPGEEFVSVEALAFIQLAKKVNIPNRVQHRMIPPELQNARPVVLSDGYPSWPG